MVELAIFMRAVNVGGTGKLIMSELRSACARVGFQYAATYLASGNLLIASCWNEEGTRERVNEALASISAAPPRYVIRTVGELVDILARNPFMDAPPSKVLISLLDQEVAPDAITSISGQRDEQVSLSGREAFILYPDGVSSSRLRVRAIDDGTSRNVNTIRAVHSRLCSLHTARPS